MQINHVYWLAGLLEGEGCFHPQVGGSIVISVSMTDADTVDRAAELFGDSRSRRVVTKGRTITGKAVFQTQVYGARAAGWMMTLYPLMSARRQRKIRECLSKWRTQAIPARDRMTCPFGHPFAYIKKGIGTRRVCLVCAAARNREYRQRKTAGLVQRPTGIARCGHPFDVPDQACRTCAVREAGRRFRAVHGKVRRIKSHP